MSSHRVARVASEIRRILGDAIANKLQDPRISRFASVTRVEVARDLAVAKTYISIMGTEAEKRLTMEALHHARGHLQSIVARKLSVRQCPQLRFHLDETLHRVMEVERIIDESMRELEDRQSKQDPEAEPPGPETLHETR